MAALWQSHLSGARLLLFRLRCHAALGSTAWHSGSSPLSYSAAHTRERNPFHSSSSSSSSSKICDAQLRTDDAARFRCAEAPRAAPLPAAQDTRTYQGHRWKDEYRWMETASRETLRHLQEEAKYAEAVLSGLQPLRARLEQEMQDRSPPVVGSLPEELGEWRYFTTAARGQPMATYMREKVDGSSKPEVIIDCNQLQAQHEFGSVGTLKLSPCQGRLAYTVDSGGDERFSCWVKDLTSGEIMHGDTLGAVGSVEWTADGQCLLYTVLEEDGRPSRVMRHKLGTAVAHDDCLLHEPDPAAYLDISRTKDWAYLVVNINSKAFSEVHLLSPGATTLRLVSPRKAGHQYFVEHSHGQLVILANLGSPNYDLMTVAACDPDLTDRAWKPVFQREEDLVLEDMDVFNSCAVIYCRRHGMPEVAVLRMPPGAPHSSGPLLERLRLPPWALALEPGVNPDPAATQLLLCTSSPIHPHHWLRFDLTNPKEPPAVLRVEGQCHCSEHCCRKGAHDRPLGGSDLSPNPMGIPAASMKPEDARNTAPKPWVNGICGGLQCSRILVNTGHGSAVTGSHVPVTVFHRQGLALDGTAPLLLSMYGAYGMSMETDFSSHRLSLLERGWVIALAHCRGGGELGQAWHLAGAKLNKPRSLADSRAVLDHLLDTGYSSPGKVAVHAFSAGGLLLGHLVNARTGAIAAAWAQSPFVDLLTAMTNPQLPLTVHEYDEWGDPQQPETFRNIASVCPYHNSAATAAAFVDGAPRGCSGGPAVLITTSMDDARVPFWGPAKWAARLRARHEAAREGFGGPVVLCCNRVGGHYQHEVEPVADVARGYAFLIAAVRARQTTAGPDGEVAPRGW